MMIFGVCFVLYLDMRAFVSIVIFLSLSIKQHNSPQDMSSKSATGTLKQMNVST